MERLKRVHFTWTRLGRRRFPCPFQLLSSRFPETARNAVIRDLARQFLTDEAPTRRAAPRSAWPRPRALSLVVSKTLTFLEGAICTAQEQNRCVPYCTIRPKRTRSGESEARQKENLIDQRLELSRLDQLSFCRQATPFNINYICFSSAPLLFLRLRFPFNFSLTNA